MKRIQKMLEKFSLCQEGKEAVLEGAERIFSTHEQDIEIMCDLWWESRQVADTLSLREKVAEETGLSVYMVNAVLILAMSDRAKKMYEEKGWSEELFFDSMDFSHNVMECKQVKGVWGMFVPQVFNAFFAPRLWRHGRLSFGLTIYQEEEPITIGGMTVKKGDRVYGVHIPSGGPLTEEMRMDSYRRAYAFFKDELGGKPMICTCESWLMFEKNREIFPPHLNMIRFMDDFRIIKSEEYDTFEEDCWRIFGCEWPEDLIDLPTDNTPRRALAAWLQSGKKAGFGLGIFAFDGEKLIHE